MLSQSTQDLLAELQTLSHAAYPEGGLMYTYVEAANQAHSRYRRADGHVLSDEQLGDLARFLQSSQGDYAITAANQSFVLLAQQLLAHLSSDLSFDQVSWSMDDGGHDMDGTLTMARRADNRFFALELMWSVD